MPTSRILTGCYKGQKLQLPEDEKVRPSKALVVKSGLDMLASRGGFHEKQVIDLFCGSGQWGIEALSRGAAHVTFVDQTISHAAKNAEKLNIPSEKVRFLRKNLADPIDLPAADILFADPPYQTDLIKAILNQLQWGNPGSLWLLETAGDATLEVPPPFTLIKHTRYGNSALWLLQQH